MLKHPAECGLIGHTQTRWVGCSNPHEAVSLSSVKLVIRESCPLVEFVFGCVGTHYLSCSARSTGMWTVNPLTIVSDGVHVVAPTVRDREFTRLTITVVFVNLRHDQNSGSMATEFTTRTRSLCLSCLLNCSHGTVGSSA